MCQARHIHRQAECFASCYWARTSAIALMHNRCAWQAHTWVQLTTVHCAGPDSKLWAMHTYTVVALPHLSYRRPVWGLIITLSVRATTVYDSAVLVRRWTTKMNGQADSRCHQDLVITRSMVVPDSPRSPRYCIGFDRQIQSSLIF